MHSALRKDKLSERDALGPHEAPEASAHATQLQNMTSTMGKYQLHQKNLTNVILLPSKLYGYSK